VYVAGKVTPTVHTLKAGLETEIRIDWCVLYSSIWQN